MCIPVFHSICATRHGKILHCTCNIWGDQLTSRWLECTFLCQRQGMKFAWFLGGFLPDLHGQFISMTYPRRTAVFSLGPRDPKGIDRGAISRPENQTNLKPGWFFHTQDSQSEAKSTNKSSKTNSQSKIVWTVWRPVTRIYTSIFVASPPLTLGTCLPAWILYGAMECPLRFLMGLTVQRNKTIRN